MNLDPETLRSASDFLKGLSELTITDGLRVTGNVVLVADDGQVIGHIYESVGPQPQYKYYLQGADVQ